MAVLILNPFSSLSMSVWVRNEKQTEVGGMRHADGYRKEVDAGEPLLSN